MAVPAAALVCSADGQRPVLSGLAMPCRGAKGRQQPCSARGWEQKAIIQPKLWFPGGLLAVTDAMPLEMLRDTQQAG